MNLTSKVISGGITSEQLLLEKMSVDEYYQELSSNIMYNELKEEQMEKAKKNK